MHGRAEKCIQDFGRNNWRRHNFEGLSGRIILNNIKMDLKEIGGNVWT
jgi:hypothetical protein